MNQEQFFQELRTALHREGFTPQPEQDELLPVEWDGLPLCRITSDGGVRYWQEDVATPERERACERATDLACTVREYMTLLEQAPPGLASNSSHGTGASTAQVSTRAITFRKTMQVPNRTSPSAPASFPNSRSSIRNSLSKSTTAALIP